MPGSQDPVELDYLNVFGLQSLGAGDDLKLDGLAFLQAAEALGLNRRVMDEDIVSVLPADETKTFRVVKPLHCSFFHVVILCSKCVLAEVCQETWSGKRGQNRR